MTLRKHANNYSSTLNGAINNSVTTIVVASATGLPAIGAGEVYNLTLDDGAGVEEIVTVTDDASSPSLTVTRGAEGTTAVSWSNGATIELRATADSLDRKLDSVTGDSNEIVIGSTDANNKTIGIADNPVLPGTGGVVLPQGSTGSRPGASTFGKIRCNTSTGNFEFDNGSDWRLIPDLAETLTSRGIPVFGGTNDPSLASTSVLISTDNNLSANSLVAGYTTTATAAGTTTLTVASTQQQFFTGSTTQNCDMPVTSTLSLGHSFLVVNNSSGVVTVRSSGGNTILAMPATSATVFTCILTSGTTAASWDYKSWGGTGSGSGDVVGPGSATDNAVVRFDSTTGKLVQNSAVIIADTTGNISGCQQVTASSAIVVGGNSTAAGYIDLLEDSDNGSHKIRVTAPSSIASDKTITLPDTTGTVALTANKLDAFAATTSAELRTVISDETGSAGLVFAQSPALLQPTADNFIDGYTTTATAAGTTTLTVTSNNTQIFTGSTTQNCNLPVVSTLVLGTSYRIVNLSTGVVTVRSSGSNTIQAMQANSTLTVVSNATSGTGASVWHVVEYTAAASGQTGSGSLVRATSPTLVTPALGTPASGTLTNCTGLPANGLLFRGFRASRSTAQTIVTSTSTKLQLNTEEYDTAGEYDPTTNYRHTPTVAGKWLYLCCGSIVSLGDGKGINVKIYKNGSAVQESKYMASASASMWGQASVVLDMNGTTDYVELYISHDHGSNRDTDAFASVNWLSGSFIGV